MLATPIGEASDEPRHFPVADYVARTGQLPYQDPAVETLWEQEGSQPPLYYMLTALIIAPFNRDDVEAHLYHNPHAKIGIGLARDNQNMLVHADEAFPWRGTVLAWMLARLFSIALGTGTVWLTFAIARLVAPGQPLVALLAMALVAFNPMFLFIAASVNNDNLVIFLGTWILALSFSLYLSGWNWRQIGMLAVLVGLAAITKLSGLTFAPVVGLAILLVWHREKRLFNDLLKATLVCAVSLMVIAGWWYVRNLDLYGDLTGLNHMVDIAGHRPDDFTIGDLWAEREGFFYSYWGWFGGLNVLGPQNLFRLAQIICLVGIVGLLVSGARREHGIQWVLIGLLLLLLVTIVVGLIRWTLMTPASQGRLLFPGIAAISTLLAIGIVNLATTLRLSGRWSLVLFGVLAGYAVILPTIIIRPAYTPPDTVEALPQNAQQVDVQYGLIQLLGYTVTDTPVTLWDDGSGEIEITLYWRPTAHTETPLSFFVQVFGPSTNDLSPQLIGKLDSYPGRGLRRTDTWELNRIYQETYTIEIIDAAMLGSFEPRFKIGWRDNATDTVIDATQIDGRPLEGVVVYGGSVRTAGECPMPDVDVRFGAVARLRKATLNPDVFYPGQSFDLTLSWETLGRTAQPHAIFVQLIDLAAPTILHGSGDAPPRSGWYPTHRWATDVCFDDSYTVRINPATPPGTYRLLVGLYDSASGLRQPVRVMQGEQPPFPDAYVLDFDVVIGE